MEEARASVDQLTILVRKVLDNNQDMSQRMARLEVRSLGRSPNIAPTTYAPGEKPAAVETHADTNSDDASCLTMDKAGLGSEAMFSDSSDSHKQTFEFSFDNDLNKSRPYTRAMKRSLIWSPRSSAIGTIGWSCLSNLSLADVSEISVINLPMSPRELWNGERYSTSYLGFNSVGKGIEEGLSPATSEILPILQSGQSFQSRVGAMSRLGSISPTSNRGSGKTRSTSLKIVKRLLKTKSESLAPEGRRTPSISIGDSGIPIAILPRKILLLGMVQLLRDSTSLTVSFAYNIVLGASLSGKTTIYNHLQILYDKDFSKADRWDARQWVVNYLIDAFKTAKEDMEFIQTDRGTEMRDAKVRKNKVNFLRHVRLVLTECLP